MHYLSAQDVLRDLLVKYKEGTGGQADACCPFPDHNDRSPSFRINIDPGSLRYLQWTCNGCGKRGNGWRILSLLLGDKNEALVESLLPKLSTRQVEFAARRNTPEESLPEALLSIYADYTLNQLLAVGFSQETLDLHEVGWDERLASYTYPIRDYTGRLVGIYRRRTEGEGPKYLPYMAKDFPEGLVPRKYAFRKSRHLYGLNMELRVPAKRKTILVEGQKARMWVHQHCGDEVHVVADMGTSLSDWQIQQLSFLPSPYIVFYDNSYRARTRGRDVSRQLRKAGLPARAVRKYHEDKDAQPDDLTPDELKGVLRL